MSLTIYTNISAQKAITQANRSFKELGRTYERLSSGLRIIRASDDAAGLSIAENLRADSRIANMAIRNVNDGISFVSLRNSALGEITSILIRMSELAQQSSNGTLSAAQKSPIFQEFVALGSEINRIVATTKFNDITVLSNTQTISIQVGLDSSKHSQIILNDFQLDTERLGLNLNSDNYMKTETIKNAIDSVSQMQIDNSSRLEFAKSHMENMRENFKAAESQIRDADIAKEAADLIKLKILNQASIAILGQANIQPEYALKLLPVLID